MSPTVTANFPYTHFWPRQKPNGSFVDRERSARLVPYHFTKKNIYVQIQINYKTKIYTTQFDLIKYGKEITGTAHKQTRNARTSDQRVCCHWHTGPRPGLASAYVCVVEEHYWKCTMSVWDHQGHSNTLLTFQGPGAVNHKRLVPPNIPLCADLLVGGLNTTQRTSWNCTPNIESCARSAISRSLQSESIHNRKGILNGQELQNGDH